MSGTTKRLDLQFGSFACSVQGFDDPVQPVQQVLQALQNMLEETPQIGNSGLVFDTGAIEQLIGEIARRADLNENDVEIVPGLIVVQRGDARAAGHDDEQDEDIDDGQIEGSEAWSRPFVADADVAASPDDTADAEPAEAEAEETDDDDAPKFINIFAPSGHAAATDTESDDGEIDPEPEPVEKAAADTPEPAEVTVDDDGDPFEARLRRIASTISNDADNTDEDTGDADLYEAAEDTVAGDSTRDIFAEPGDSADGNIFANPMADDIAAEPVDEDAPVNFFSAPDNAAETADDSVDDPVDDLVLEDAVENSARGEALFGQSDDQPEVADSDEGYTAAGLAQTAGAETVAELIVSAAAWMVLIQGQTTFTRHDVIEVFAAMPGEHSKTLEARIKGFGKAVRNEQLIMVEDGVFGLARVELERFQSLL